MLVDAHTHLDSYGELLDTALAEINDNEIISVSNSVDVPSYERNLDIGERCDYVYDPELGDPDGGVDPGTAFEALPDDWVCPVCGARQEAFSPVE